jgi:hypothetical protein
MDLQIIQITPLESWLARGVERPTDSPEFNYKAILINESDRHFYWANGVSLEINREEYEFVTANPKLFLGSITYKLHQRIEIMKNLGKKSERN